MRTRYDALVIGAGPAGSMTSALLARAGWNVALIEKCAFPRRKVCGEFLSAPTWPIFDELGIGSALRSLAGPPIRRVGLFARRAALYAAMPEALDLASGWGRALSREKLDRLLLDEAVWRGVSLWQPYEAVELAHHRGIGECRLAGAAGEHVLRAPLVVDAHGSWGRRGFAAGPRRPVRNADLLAFKAHFEGAALATGTMPLLAFPGGYGGMVTTDDGRLCLSCCIRRDALEACRRAYPGLRAGEAVLEHILCSCAAVRAILERAVRLGPWLAAGPVQPGIRQSADGGAIKVGNAAGEAHPVIAEGISMAVQGAHLLAQILTSEGETLAGSGRLSDLHIAYTRAWRARFATRLRFSGLIARLAMRTEAGGLLAPLLQRHPGIITMGARLSGKTARAVC
ncbi:MAG TPA: NAD(P)/FAD-dependent oxidoreductase [Gammaproteobacteria bacterium]|nr:NAD(P)/FAD-dependent oxidoreductase [Gammaproteobacteria bacterium]